MLRFLPGLLAGILVAIYFQHQSAQGIILAVLFAALVTFAIAQADTISKLQKENSEQETKINILEHSTNENFKNLSGAMVEDLQALEATLSDQFGTEIHELAVMIANQRFGEED